MFSYISEIVQMAFDAAQGSEFTRLAAFPNHARSLHVALSGPENYWEEITVFYKPAGQMYCRYRSIIA